MEAFLSRHEPQTIEMLNRIKSGVIGEVRQIYADFGFTKTDIESNVSMKPELGEGSALDTAVYLVSMIRAITGSKLMDIFAYSEFDNKEFDVFISAILRHGNGVTAQLNCSFNAAPHRLVRVLGSVGIISCGYNNITKPDKAFIELKKGIDWNYEMEKIAVPNAVFFLFEAEAFYSNIKSFEQRYEGSSKNESLDNTDNVIEMIKSAKCIDK